MYYNDYYYYSSGSDDIASVLLGLSGMLWVFMLAVAAILTVSQWKMFKKAGIPGWTCLIPFYNSYKVSELAFGPGYGYIGLLAVANILIGWIPIIGWITTLLVQLLTIYSTYKFIKAYNVGTGMTIASFFFPVIVYPIIAFSSKYQYIGFHPVAPFGLPKIGGNSYSNLRPQSNGNNQYNNQYSGNNQYNNQYNGNWGVNNQYSGNNQSNGNNQYNNQYSGSWGVNNQYSGNNQYNNQSNGNWAPQNNSQSGGSNGNWGVNNQYSGNNQSNGNWAPQNNRFGYSSSNGYNQPNGDWSRQSSQGWGQNQNNNGY